MRFVAGERLGRWELIRELNQGGNAQVWLGKSPDGEQAALKILTEWQPATERYQRFQNEVNVHHRIGRRPGVLPMIDFDFPEVVRRNYPWLAMPVAIPLKEHLGKTPELTLVVHAVATIAETLAALQTLDVAHRDIKPDNLYWLDGSAAIGDLGLARFPEQISLTDDGRAVGPRNFMAPEMIANPSTADPFPADVWLLAKTLWVLAAGQTWPPPGEIRAGVPYARLREWVTHPRVPLIEQVIEHATQLLPSDRPAMSDFASQLRSWLTGPPAPVSVMDLTDLGEQLAAMHAPERLRRERQTLWRAQFREAIKPLPGALHQISRAITEAGLTTFGTGGRALLDKYHPYAQAHGDPDQLDLHFDAFIFHTPTRGGMLMHFQSEFLGRLFEDGSMQFAAGYLTSMWSPDGQHDYRIWDSVWSEVVECQVGTPLAEQKAAELANDFLMRLRPSLDRALAEANR